MKYSKMDIKKLAQEYEAIGILERVSELEANRLEEILEIAESNSHLNSLLDEIDLRLAQEQGFLDQENMNYIENQRTKLIRKMENYSGRGKTSFFCYSI